MTGVIQYANSLSGSETRLLNLDQAFEAVLGDPAAYGITNTTDPCVTPNLPPYQCATPDTYVFWDGLHPTKAMHAIIAQRAIATILGQ